MSEAPERIWIEDEFGEGDDDQWTYGTWDVRNYMGYDVEYVRADILQALTAERDGLLRCVTDNHVALCRAEAAETERDEALNQLDSARYSVDVLEQRMAEVMAERDRLREALDGLLTSVEHADFEDGWCCCGDDMLHHQSPMDCGHTPVDMGEYHASLAIKKARAALKGGAT